MKKGRLWIPLDAAFFIGDGSHLSDEAQLLFLRMLTHSKLVSSNGVISSPQLTVCAGKLADHIHELVDSGFVEQDLTRWVIPSWAEWNRSNPDSESESDGSRADGQMANHVRWHIKRGIVSPSCSFCSSSRESPTDHPSDSESESLEREERDQIRGKNGSDDPTSPSAQRSLSEDIAAANPRIADRYLESDFIELWSIIPKRKTDGRGKTLTAYRARRKEGAPHADLLAAAKHYADDPERLSKPEFTKGSAVFLAKDGPWENFVHISSGSVSPVRPGALEYNPDAPSVFDRPGVPV